MRSRRRAASGVTFAAIIGLYVVLGATLVITLRAMSRRWREADEEAVDVPYGPEPPAAGAFAGAPQ